MPIIGMGGGVFGEEADASFDSALSVGYRLFDTAPKYGQSEAALGRALHRSGIARENLFLVSKVGNVGHAQAITSFERTLAKLQTKYLDLLLMHSAINQQAAGDPRSRLHASTRIETWKAMKQLKDEGRVLALGVCNFSPRQIAALNPLPDVVQIEFHPMLQRRELVTYCHKRGIVVTAYGTGGGGWKLWRKDQALDLLGRPAITAAAEAHGWSAHQVSIRWTLEQGIAVIPKAATREHQLENRADKIFGSALSEEEAQAITALGSEHRSLYNFKDPDTYT